jgi:hypothetical protein
LLYNFLIFKENIDDPDNNNANTLPQSPLVTGIAKLDLGKMLDENPLSEVLPKVIEFMFEVDKESIISPPEEVSAALPIITASDRLLSDTEKEDGGVDKEAQGSHGRRDLDSKVCYVRDLTGRQGNSLKHSLRLMPQARALPINLE